MLKCDTDSVYTHSTHMRIQVSVSGVCVSVYICVRVRMCMYVCVDRVHVYASADK